MGLKIAIVGAGIAGLAQAISLSKEGHDVIVYERSEFKNEVGAAITMTPNGSRILDRWNFDFDAAGAEDCMRMELARADNLECIHRATYANMIDQFGYEIKHFHRADLHNGLRRLAESTGTQIRLGSPVEDVTSRGGFKIKGQEWSTADIVVIADGAYSQHLAKITENPEPLQKLGRSIIRSLVSMSKVKADPELAAHFGAEPPGFYIPCTQPPDPTQMVTYPCRKGTVLNIAIAHNTMPEYKDRDDWHSPMKIDDALEVIKDFHPACHRMLREAEDTTIYNLSRRELLSRTVNDRLVVVGDAATVIPPSQLQGGVKAIEEACALGVFLRGVDKQKDVSKRLRMYEQLVKPRIQTVQLLSEAMPGQNSKSRQQAEALWVGGGYGSLYSDDSLYYAQDVQEFFYGYDIRKEAERALEEASMA